MNEVDKIAFLNAFARDVIDCQEPRVIAALMLTPKAEWVTIWSGETDRIIIGLNELAKRMKYMDIQKEKEQVSGFDPPEPDEALDPYDLPPMDLPPDDGR